MDRAAKNYSLLCMNLSKQLVGTVYLVFEHSPATLMQINVKCTVCRVQSTRIYEVRERDR